MNHYALADVSRDMQIAGCGIVVGVRRQENPLPYRIPGQPPTPRSRKFKNIRVRDAILSVSQERGVTVDDILGRSRKKHIVAARHEAIRAVAKAVDWKPNCGNWTGGFWSSIAIGNLFGRDHTTILWVLGQLTNRNQPKTPILCPREAA